jgi:leucyl aminopeptidase (aminopeptidase T)
MTTFSSEGQLDENTKSIFLDDSTKVIILALSRNIWHTKERKSAKYEREKRLINVLHPDLPCESYRADISYMRSVGRQITKILEESNHCQIHITTETGTDVRAMVGRVFCETGDYSSPRSGGDFPAGEVGFGPIELSVSGRIVLDYKIQHVGFVKDALHVIDVKEDEIYLVGGSKEYDTLLNSHTVLKYISEISIGINPIWTEVKNPSSIVEEKNQGTVHFGCGGNLSYGNREGPHFDSVILNPTIELDSQILMSKGVFNDNFIKAGFYL